MRPTPPRTNDRPAEGIRHDEMTPAEVAVVAQEVAAHMQPQRDADGRYSAPITPGFVRRSRSNAPWVTWCADPDARHATWFRLMDVPSDPDSGYPGARVVFDGDDRPLGSINGPLVLTDVRGCPTAFCVNTGANLTSEIHWPDTDAVLALVPRAQGGRA